MPPPRRLDPLAALRRVTSDRPASRVETVALDATGTGYLARSLAIGPGAEKGGAEGGGWRLLADGYLVAPGTREGSVLGVSGRLSAGEIPAHRGPPEGEALRVESGTRLPAGAPPRAFVPVAGATVTGSERIRVDGPVLDTPVEFCFRAQPRTLPAGTELTPRLRSWLLSRGLGEVECVVPPRVGLLSIGSELRGLLGGPSPGERETGSRVPDTTAFWLEREVARLGCPVVRLGIAADEPEEIRRGFLRARDRRVDVLIASGGLGEGVDDRTVEGLARIGSRVHFQGVRLDLASRLALARTSGLEVLGMGGTPLAAAAAFDLWVRPALLARAGAAPSSWDWSGSRVRLATPPPPPPPLARPGDWRLLEAFSPSGESAGPFPRAEARPLPPGDPFAPDCPGSGNWVVVEPGETAWGLLVPGVAAR